jgi:hypothetical protein
MDAVDKVVDEKDFLQGMAAVNLELAIDSLRESGVPEPFILKLKNVEREIHTYIEKKEA